MRLPRLNCHQAAAASGINHHHQQQIEIVHSGDPCTASCSGRIKLEITAPCSSSVTVSVSPCHGPRAGDPSAAHVPRCGPCVAPASPLSYHRHPAPCCAPAEAQAGLASCCDPPEDEIAVLARATAHLKESGWYYGMLSYQEAQLLLREAEQGTFLARDSFDRRFLFALTVQTSQGATSVRVQFLRGRFRLDAPAALISGMPTFSDVNSLVEHYARHGHVLYDQKGRPLLQMRLSRPLRREVPSLEHCCRLALNGLRPRPEVMPERLRRYLDQYPFSR